MTPIVRRLLLQKRNKTLVNMLGSYGNLTLDSNSDGLADKLFASNITNTLENSIQTITATATSTEHYSQFSNADMNFSWQTNDKLYLSGWIKTYLGGGLLRIFNRISNGTYEVQTATTANTGDFELLSVLLPITSLYASPTLFLRQIITSKTTYVGSFSGSGEKIDFKKITLLNLTSIFGAGNEPAKAVIDTFIQSNPDYFTQIDYMKA